MNEPLLLKPEEAAKALSISQRSLWSLTNRKLVPFIRIGKSVRYSREALAEWIRVKNEATAI